MKKVETLKAIQAGWTGVKNNLWLLLGLALAYVVVAAVGEADSPLVGLASWVGQMVLMAVIIIVSLRIIRDEGAKQSGIGDLPLSPGMVAKFIGANLLTALIVVLGLVLLIVPGVIWGLKYSFSAAFVLDEDCSIGDSLRKSEALTQGVKWGLLQLVLALIGIVIAGLLCLGVGVLPAFMVAQLAWAWAYVDLKRQAAEAA